MRQLYLPYTGEGKKTNHWVGSMKRVVQFSSVAQSCPTLCDLMHESQHARPPCPSPTPGVYPNPCPSSRWCHPAISSSGVPFSSCPQSFPASGSFPMSQLFAWGGQSIGVSASPSVLPTNTQDWSPEKGKQKTKISFVHVKQDLQQDHEYSGFWLKRHFKGTAYALVRDLL